MKAGIRKTIYGLKSYMEKHGYTGVMYPGECGCEISDLAPCGEDHSGCELGWKVEPDEEALAEGCNFMVTSVKPKEK